MTLYAQPSEQQSLGYFRIFAQPPGGKRREITIFRGAPVILNRASWSDPFSDQTAQLSFPQITMFDELGTGDLDWFVADCNIDIVWQNTGDYDLTWTWEGYLASEGFSMSGQDTTFTVDLKGALYGLDDYLAIPSFPKRPIPYEILMAMAFDQQAHPTGLGEFRVSFPEDWDKTVPTYSTLGYRSFLKPWGVTTGQLWTGFTSRSTGSWEPLLTGHVQGLLTVMFAAGGAQWSVRNRGNRTPELFLRTIPDYEEPQIVEIELGAPGVGISGSRDYTQRASVIYGQGVDDAGISYSGMQVTPDGKTTYYKPFAFNSSVWPRKDNPSYNKNLKPKETMVRFQDGVDELAAVAIAKAQYQRFAEPGITGTITLQTDPRYANGELCPPMLMQAGFTVRIKGLFGIHEGVQAHITQCEVDFTNLTTTLTFDTKYRDQLTVAEVMARTKDALTPLRALQVGKYSNTVQDLVLPWSTDAGSGVVPTGANEFFSTKIPSDASFPYESWTKKYPPKKYKAYYLRINPTDKADSSKNWTQVARDGQALMSIPIRMAQSGTIKLSQFAAYDEDGNVMPVRFHVSIYTSDAVTANSAPQFPSDPLAATFRFLKPEGVTGLAYKTGQANPFFKDAWEEVRSDGTTYKSGSYITAPQAGLVIGWGNYYEPAGYSPGRASRGAARTGMLEDTSSWTWDLSSQLDLQSIANNANQEYAGMLFLQIFCDEQNDKPVYFLGRMFRQEPGTT